MTTNNTRNIALWLFALLIMPLQAMAEDANAMLAAADSAYTAADYSRALTLYTDAVAANGRSAELYYNLGNAYYRTGNIPQAILNYERALRLKPNLRQARENLEFVNSKVIDRPGVRYSFFESASRNIAQTMNSNAWAWVAFAMIVLLASAVLIYYFSENILLRKSGFFGGIICLLLVIFCIFEAFYARSLARADDEAIITSKSVILSTSPRAPLNSDEEAMLLHEGTKLTIEDSLVVETDSVKTTWYDVKVDLRHRAWISSTEVEKI